MQGVSKNILTTTDVRENGVVQRQSDFFTLPDEAIENVYINFLIQSYEGWADIVAISKTCRAGRRLADSIKPKAKLVTKISNFDNFEKMQNVVKNFNLKGVCLQLGSGVPAKSIHWALKQASVEAIRISDIGECVNALNSFTPNIQKEAILKLIRGSSVGLSDIGGDTRANRDIVLEAVRLDGLALRHAHPDLKNDLQVVLEAVRENGLALRYAHPDLKNNSEVVLEAVRENGRALEYASEDLRGNNIEVVLAALEESCSAMQFVMFPIKDDPRVYSTYLNSRIHERY